jgi:hypothetical protein
MRKIQEKGKADRAAGAGASLRPTSDAEGAAKLQFPPPCNTGGKLPAKLKKNAGGLNS